MSFAFQHLQRVFCIYFGHSLSLLLLGGLLQDEPIHHDQKQNFLAAQIKFLPASVYHSVNFGGKIGRGQYKCIVKIRVKFIHKFIFYINYIKVIFIAIKLF